MARGAVINKRVKVLIEKILLEHPRWGATRIQREVVRQLHDTKSRFHDPNVDDNWPGVSAVQKKLKDIRPKYQNRLQELEEELEELDKPWSVVTLAEAKHEMSSEALPIVLEIYVSKLLEGIHLTVREAKWVARLSSVLNKKEDYVALCDFAIEYANAEKAAQLLDINVDELTDDLGLYNKMTGNDVRYNDIRRRILEREAANLHRKIRKLKEKEARDERPHSKEV